MSAIYQSLEDLIYLQAKAKGISLFKKRNKAKNMAGINITKFKSSGIEFDEVRLYQTGDEMRSIDWRVTARKGNLHTKTFREEQDNSVLIGCDLHNAMYFGTKNCFKSVLAMQLISVLAWMAEAKGDRVGGIVGHDNNNSLLEIKPKHGTRGILPLFNALVKCQPKQQGRLQRGRLDQLLARLNHLAKKGSHIIIVSDFSEAGNNLELYLKHLTHHNQVKVIFVYDEFEKTLPDIGEIKMGIASQLLDIDTTKKTVRKNWQLHFNTRLNTIKTICQQKNITFLPCSTSANLTKFF